MSTKAGVNDHANGVGAALPARLIRCLAQGQDRAGIRGDIVGCHPRLWSLRAGRQPRAADGSSPSRSRHLGGAYFSSAKATLHSVFGLSALCRRQDGGFSVRSCDARFNADVQ